MTHFKHDSLLAAGKILSVVSQAIMALLTVGTAAIAVSTTVYGFAQTAKYLALVTGWRLEILPAIPVAIQMVIGVAATFALFVFFGKLRKIIDTVEEGTPFEAANAERLTSMAWLLFGVQVAYWLPQLATINVARVSVNGYSPYKQSFNFDALDLTGILMVLTLFILARVFRHGAAMREDLEGTV